MRDLLKVSDHLLKATTVARIKQGCISSLALGLIWGWFLFSCNAGSLTMGLEIDNPLVFRVPAIFATVAALLVLPRLHVPKPHLLFALAGVLCACGGTALLWGFFCFSALDSALFALCGILTGFAYGSLLLLWMSWSLGTNYASLLAVVTASSILMPLLFLCNMAMASISLIWAIPILLVLAPLLLLKNSRTSIDRQERSRSAIHKPLFIVSIVLSGGFCRSLFAATWISRTQVDWIWGIAPIAALIEVLIFVFRKRLTPEITFGALISLLGAAIFESLVLPPTSVFLSSTIFACSWLLFAYCAAASLWLASQDETNSLPLASGIFSLVIGVNGISSSLAPHLTQQSTGFLVVAALILIISLVLIMASLSTTAPSSTKDSLDAPVSDLNAQCTHIAEAFSLTSREADVLLLLAKGNSLKSISEKLFISESTAKTHRWHIYQKLGITSRQSLIDMIERN